MVETRIVVRGARIEVLRPRRRAVAVIRNLCGRAEGGARQHREYSGAQPPRVHHSPHAAHRTL
jgi:hypothetical protein